MMGFSFHLAAVKGLRKKKKKTKKVSSKLVELQGIMRKSRSRVIVKPNSKLSGIEKLPDDILMDILARLSAKVVTSSMCVSKLWYSLISSRQFTTLFLANPSLANPVSTIVSLVDKKHEFKHTFLSSSSSLLHDDHSDMSVSVLDQVFYLPEMPGYFVNALRGLLCVRLGRSVQICNLTTKQRVDLPIIKSQLLADPNSYISTCFGYDPVHDEYKVLNIVSAMSKQDSIVRSEHHVFVLGPRASWRNTKGHIYPHCPVSKGIFIKGVFYYRVWLDKQKSAIMSFDFNSEDFKMIELPIESGIIWEQTKCSTIMNFKDKVAVFEYSNRASQANMIIDLWVMEDVEKMEWSKITIVLPLYQMNFVVNGDQLGMQSTGSCNEVVLVETFINTHQPISYVYFDLEKNKITKKRIINLPDHLIHFWGKRGFRVNFWESDIENIMYLET